MATLARREYFFLLILALALHFDFISHRGGVRPCNALKLGLGDFRTEDFRSICTHEFLHVLLGNAVFFHHRVLLILMRFALRC